MTNSITPGESKPAAALASPIAERAVPPTVSDVDRPTGPASPLLLSLLDRTVTMAVIDTRGRFAHVGEALLSTAGYRREQLLGRRCREFLGADEDRRLRGAVTRAVARGGTWRGEIGMRAAGGERLRLDVVIAALPRADGAVTGCVVAGLDVTALALEREQARAAREASTRTFLDQVELQARLALSLAEGERREWDLESALRRMQASLESQSAVVAAIDRVVPASVAAIAERADLLAGDLYHAFPTGTRLQHLDAVKEHAQSLAMTTRGLLVLAGLEAPAPPGPVTPISPDRLLHGVATFVRDDAIARGHRLEVESQAGDAAVLDLDVPRVRHLLVGMVATEIAHGRAATITVSATVESDVTGTAQLVVSAGGRRRSFTDAEMAAIACPGSPRRVPTALADAAAIPLAVAAELARELGGTLSAECGRDGTATLSLRLPIRRHRERSRPSERDLPPACGADGSLAGPLAGRRLLVAEDCADHAVLLDDALRRAGAEVTIVTNGSAVVRAITTGLGTDRAAPGRPPFDAVLLDMLMPVMDGYAVARLLRRRGVTVPILAVTANAFGGAMKECLDAGCTAYVAKPIDRVALVERVADVIAVERAGTAA